MKIWLRVLLALLGAFALLIAAGSSPWMVVIVGAVAGCALIAEAVLLTRGRRPLALWLSLLTMPFAVLMWWSLVAPLLVATALPLAFALTARRGPARVPSGLTSVRASAAPIGTPNPLQPPVPVAAGTAVLGANAAQMRGTLLPHS